MTLDSAIERRLPHDRKRGCARDNANGHPCTTAAPQPRRSPCCAAIANVELSFAVRLPVNAVPSRLPTEVVRLSPDPSQRSPPPQADAVSIPLDTKGGEIYSRFRLPSQLALRGRGRSFNASSCIIRDTGWKWRVDCWSARHRQAKILGGSVDRRSCRTHSMSVADSAGSVNNNLPVAFTTYDRYQQHHQSFYKPGEERRRYVASSYGMRDLPSLVTTGAVGLLTTREVQPTFTKRKSNMLWR